MTQEPLDASSARDREAFTSADLVARVSRFDGPPQDFLKHLLQMQCQLASASAGAFLRTTPDGRRELVAVHPPLQQGSTTPVWLAQAVELADQVLAKPATVVKPLRSPDDLYGQSPRSHLVLLPILGRTASRGLAAFLVETTDPDELRRSSDRLELTMSLLSLYEMRLTLERRDFDLARLRQSGETLAALNEQDRFKGAAMSFTNELAARWSAERVSLGFLKGRYVQLKAVSHTEKFSRKMKLVSQTEAAMEECLDQDVEVLYPAPPDAAFVSRAAAELSRAQAASTVLSLPLRKAGDPVAVLTLERPADRPFTPDEIESLRLACELCTPRLTSLYHHDRWFGARAADSTRDALALAVGPKHTWVKLTAVLVLAALLFLLFAKGDYRAEAPFVVEAVQRQVIPAPFDGFLKTVSVEPGDPVAADQLLATLDTAELNLQVAEARAEVLSYSKQRDAAMRDGKIAESQIAQAQADQVSAKINLLLDEIRRANLTSPVAGFVLTGDLRRRIGAPVKIGDVLFEVAPLDSLRATLSVPEDQIADVRVRQTGELATVTFPDRRIPFTVERVNPVAEVVKDQNVFKVRVTLSADSPGLRPGMEGVAKVSIDRRHYAWIWTRRLANWLRMKLWW